MSEYDGLRVALSPLRAETLFEMPGAGVPMVRATDGGPPRLPTSFALYHDRSRLFAVMDGADDEVVASHLEHDAPLFQEDVFEIFLAPGPPQNPLTRYYEIETSPLGTTFDAVITFPGPDRSTMTADLSWNPAGLWAATERVRSPGHERRWRAVLSIPFTAFGERPPSPGAEWRANVYRIDRSQHGDEYLAWQPTGRTPPDFHVPAAFGLIRFE